MSAELPVFVLDSFAMLAYLGGESGMARVQEVLNDALQGHCKAVLSIINLGEVLHITECEVGLAQEHAVLAAIEQLPIEILPATRETVLVSAHIRANYPVAYADAFAIAAAQEFGGRLLTGDPEFEAVGSIVMVEWLSQEA